MLLAAFFAAGAVSGAAADFDAFPDDLPWPRLLDMEPLADADIPLQWAKACILNTRYPQQLPFVLSDHKDQGKAFDDELGDERKTAFRIYPVRTPYFKSAFPDAVIGLVEFNPIIKWSEKGDSFRHARTEVVTGLFHTPKEPWSLGEQYDPVVFSRKMPAEVEFPASDREVLSVLFTKIPKAFQNNEETVLEVVRSFAMCRGMWIQDVRPESDGQWLGGYRDPDEKHRQPRGIWIRSDGMEDDWATQVVRDERGWTIRVTLAETEACQCYRYVFSLRDDRLSLERVTPLSATWDWFLDTLFALHWINPNGPENPAATLVRQPALDALLGPARFLVLAEIDMPERIRMRGFMQTSQGNYWASGGFPFRHRFPVLAEEDGSFRLFRSDAEILSLLFADIPESLLADEGSVLSLVRVFAVCRAKWVQDVRPVSPNLWRGRLDERDEKQYAMPYGAQFNMMLERQRQGLPFDAELFHPAPKPWNPKTEKADEYLDRFRRERAAFKPWKEAYCFLRAIGTDEDWEPKVERLPDGWRVRIALASMDCRATIQYTLLIRLRKMSVEKRILIFSPFHEETPVILDREYKAFPETAGWSAIRRRSRPRS